MYPTISYSFKPSQFKTETLLNTPSINLSIDLAINPTIRCSDKAC